jgi:hypothetical protein
MHTQRNTSSERVSRVENLFNFYQLVEDNDGLFAIFDQTENEIKIHFYQL